MIKTGLTIPARRARRRFPDHICCAPCRDIDRSASHGFRILDNEAGQPDVIVKERHKEQFKRGNAIVTLATAVFEGHLEVTDADLFRGTLCHGVGRAKGFGCGLLTVASETENRAE